MLHILQDVNMNTYLCTQLHMFVHNVCLCVCTCVHADAWMLDVLQETQTERRCGDLSVMFPVSAHLAPSCSYHSIENTLEREAAMEARLQQTRQPPPAQKKSSWVRKFLFFLPQGSPKEDEEQQAEDTTLHSPSS